MEHRLLTPTEAVLLLSPSVATAAKCIQAGLFSLLAAGRIAFHRPPSLFMRSQLELELRASGPSPLPRHLVVLEQALAERAGGRPLRASEVMPALQKRFGIGYTAYLKDEVAPGLIQRGLLARREGKLLGLIRYTSFQRTAPGDALVAPLQRLMAALDKLRSLRKSDPAEAVRLARSAGVLLLMSPAARTQIPKLRKLLQTHRDDDMGSYLPTHHGGPDTGDVDALGDLCAGLDNLSLFDGLESISDCTGSSDGSSSSGSDGGGGDGGGGGGGGD